MSRIKISTTKGKISDLEYRFNSHYFEGDITKEQLEGLLHRIDMMRNHFNLSTAP